jgi:hypothetical protein
MAMIGNETEFSAKEMHIAQLKGTSLRQKKKPKDGRYLSKNGLKRAV